MVDMSVRVHGCTAKLALGKEIVTRCRKSERLIRAGNVSSPSTYQILRARTETKMATSTSTARALPPPPIARSQQALIHEYASLTGTHPIIVGADTIIQLRTKIISAHGPVTIGDGCVVAERAVIGLVGSLGAERCKGWGGEVILGNGVIIESGAMVEGKMLGEGTIVEVGAVVGRGSVIGKVGDWFVIVGLFVSTLPFSLSIAESRCLLLSIS